ncbi:MAG: hypothetical protein DWQ07_08385 [Chloroflexi bacterium]|nr:MAG: hypothetical protein DWQ07_08385 [Chloroflexota bacterium]MBL1193271.1 hypothetical protein [Chloroflexota bacterium]NOH10564.1 hypothetical protein [Chloroflexota bacterium]
MNLPPYVEDEIRSLVEDGRKIEAIKRVRELSGAGLKEAKDYIDYMAKQPAFGDQESTLLSFEEVMRDHEGELRDMLRNKGKIQAIKRVRQLTGTGLKEAKDFIENIEKDILL